MIEFIKTVFGEGDTIYISQKGQEVGGRILSINDAFIVIETEDGNIIGVKEDAIDSFSKESVRKPGKNLNYTIVILSFVQVVRAVTLGLIEVSIHSHDTKITRLKMPSKSAQKSQSLSNTSQVIGFHWSF